MDAQTKNTTEHRIALADELIRLSPDISPNDRDIAMKELGIKSRITISAYLNGRIGNVDVAAQLIVFFKKQIAKRNLVLLDSVSNKQLAHA
jgi:hypothetical protein